MKILGISCVSVALGVLVAGASAQEGNRSGSNLSAPVVELGRPIPYALGRPEPMGDRIAGSTNLDPQVVPVGYPGDSVRFPVIRAQAPDFPAPPVSPPIPSSPPPGFAPPVPGPAPPYGGIPATPQERYNCGIVTEPPSGGHGFWKGCQDFIGGICGGAPGRFRLQSDHGFDGMISPVSNPFLFEDPRALTEIRPLFMFQGTPSDQYAFQGGNIYFAGLQARLALTERLSFVMSELGWVWMQPDNPIPGFEDTNGFAELRLGPKYTFYRCEDTGCVAAAGLNFELPVGSSRVFQDTGDLSLEPYISVGKTFLQSSYGSFNFMNTTGYSFSVDSQRTDYLFSSFHLDYNIGRLNRIYPFVEMNWFHYTTSGSATSLGFEGRDLFNFGSNNVSGNDLVTIAPGLRYKFSEAVQAGVAVEIPLGRRDLMDYRVSLDMIFRY